MIFIKALKYTHRILILLSLFLFVIKIILDTLSFLYQGAVYIYYTEKHTIEYALQYKEKGVRFSEISNDIFPIIITVFILTIVFSIIRALVFLKKNNWRLSKSE